MAGELYESDFRRDFEKAVLELSKLSDKTEKRVATKWLNKIGSLRSEDPQTKKNRNCVLKYFLRVLRDSVESGAKQRRGHHGGEILARWSRDGRVYVAIKPLPNEGALVYMAVSDDPALGWDFPKTET